MKKRTPDKFWFPWWPDKWIFGSMRIECTAEERGIWLDLYCIASKDNGFIRANEETPYPISQLAGMLIIPEKTLREAIEKFIELKDKDGNGKLTRTEFGTLYITKYEKYQFTDRHKRRVDEGMSEETDTMSEEKDPILKKNILDKKKKDKIKKHKEYIREIILYFNEKTGKKFRIDPQGFISGRLNDGYTVEDCKKVIDIKTAQWLNDPENNKWLRPLTLFRPSNFEGYFNEKISVKTKKEKEIEDWVKKPLDKEGK